MFMNRRMVMSSLAAGAMLLAVPMATAAGKQPFNAEAFAAAQKAGKPILVEVTAPWCPTCRAQKPIIERLSADPRFKNLAIFEVDFDSRKDVLATFRATRQSTLIVFKGAAEVGRSVGDTRPEGIEALLAKSL